jgi:hypothetical protein
MTKVIKILNKQLGNILPRQLAFFVDILDDYQRLRQIANIEADEQEQAQLFKEYDK